MNIEEIFKSSLGDSEMPYDPGAWESMSARLDQAMPAAQAPKASRKWAWVASAAVVVGISAFFLAGRETHVPGKQQFSKVIPAERKEDRKAASAASAAPAPQASGKTPKAALIQAEEPATANVSGRKEKVRPLFSGSGSASCAGASAHTAASGISGPGPVTAGESPKSSGSKPMTFTAPVVSSKYCENEKITFRNTNEYAIYLSVENGSAYPVEGGKTLTVALTETGDYYFVYPKGNGKYEKESAFRVFPKPRADFYASEETLYEDGIPYQKMEAAYNAKDYTWTNSKGEILSTDKEFKANFFTKGEHDITLKTASANGCTSQVTKSVRCETNYNLLAMTGFNPESPIRNNKTFIPYALTERKIPFEMEIIDPKGGQVIYRTKNADEPWDGTDMHTHQLVPAGSTYIWRVTIYKKEPGEPKNVYQGVITRI